MTERKPHNYWDELSPAQREELAKMDAAAAEVKRIKEIGDAQKIFSFGNLERFKIFVPSGSGNDTKPKRFRLKSKSRLRPRPRPQIHYQIRPKPRPKPVHQLAKEFRR